MKRQANHDRGQPRKAGHACRQPWRRRRVLPLGWIKRDHLIYVASIIGLIVLWHVISTTLLQAAVLSAPAAGAADRTRNAGKRRAVRAHQHQPAAHPRRVSDRQRNRGSGRLADGLDPDRARDLRSLRSVLPLRALAGVADPGGDLVRHRGNLESPDHRLYDDIHRADQHHGRRLPYRAQQAARRRLPRRHARSSRSFS